MRLCTIMFLIWWTVFVCTIWHETYKPKRRWYLHATPQHIKKVVQVRPIEFENTSILWVSILEDRVSMDLRTTILPALGKTSISSLSMDVFECDNCTKVSEVYDIPFDAFAPVENTTWSFFQNDVHLSPFRRINIMPSIDWSVGTSDGHVSKNRPGKFMNDIWEEGQDITISIGLTCLAWGMGLTFLIVTRKRQGRDVRFIFRRPPLRTTANVASKDTLKM